VFEQYWLLCFGKVLSVFSTHLLFRACFYLWIFIENHLKFTLITSLALVLVVLGVPRNSLALVFGSCDFLLIASYSTLMHLVVFFHDVCVYSLCDIVFQCSSAYRSR